MGLWVRVGVVVGPQVGLGQGNGIVENIQALLTMCILTL